jgi:hypothetical protein
MYVSREIRRFCGTPVQPPTRNAGTCHPTIIVQGEKSTMQSRAAKIAFLILIPLSTFATPNEKGTITLQVVTATTKIHGSSPGNIFTYTDLMFTEINGKNVVYECVQRGDICPVLVSGKTYTADQEGPFIYISMSPPELKKAVSAKFRQIGSW